MERVIDLDAKEIKFFEGLDDILIAMMLTPDSPNAAPTYDEIVRLPIATELAISGNGSTLEKYASSKLFRSIGRETKHEIGLTHVGIPVATLDKIKGLVAQKGVTFSKTNAVELPYFAFGFIGNIEGGGKKAVWYPKVQLSNVIDETYVTAESEIKINDVTANLNAYGLNFNNVIYSTFDSYRESAEGISLEQFIAQPVYSEEQWNKLAIEEVPVPVVGTITPTADGATIELS
ncbi:major tail protein [Enterococcus gallinarum]|uniref:major tail protein n=1 Tax=Enterococcus gallinarum TaxID=1353 RepID=UPI00374F5387